MQLRQELEPQTELAQQLLPKIIELISEYDNATDTGKRDKIDNAIKQIAQLTQKDITEEDLFEYWGAMNIEELAFSLALPSPKKVNQITKTELLEIMNRINDISIDFMNTGYHSYYIELIRINFGIANPYEFITMRKINGKYMKISDEEVAEFILNYKPIRL